ncbi:MAG: MBL fold metallo-hydrolase, partial [Zetaproteobacteria bacterium CG_4_8_14_3_um_filter_59_5]
MKIKVLGCYGGQLLGFHLTSFLINDSILLDAGSPTEALDLEDQFAIRHIFISHTHLDHIKDIAFLADNRSLKRMGGADTNRQIVVHSLPENIEVMRNDFFN